MYLHEIITKRNNTPRVALIDAASNTGWNYNSARFVNVMEQFALVSVSDERICIGSFCERGEMFHFDIEVKVKYEGAKNVSKSFLKKIEPFMDGLLDND